MFGFTKSEEKRFDNLIPVSEWPEDIKRKTICPYCNIKKKVHATIGIKKDGTSWYRNFIESCGCGSQEVVDF